LLLTYVTSFEPRPGALVLVRYFQPETAENTTNLTNNENTNRTTRSSMIC